MKPLKLIISGIGPYAGLMPEIDFQQFANDKPLLISGETGAGKTMLFDAICFALFDSASGSYRETSNMRSEYADVGEESFVDFYFEHQGREYHVYRQPSYMRPAKNKAGFKQEKEKAVFYAQGQVPIEGIRAVNTAIGELLHVDAKQFKQLAMIAQGEFWGLLNAKTEERTGILRNIFMTDGYRNLELSLRDRKTKTSKNLEILERSMVQYFQEVKAEENTQEAQELSEIQQHLSSGRGIHDVESMLVLIDKIVDKDQSKGEELIQQEQALADELVQMQKHIALADNNAENVQRYEKLQSVHEKLQGELAKAQQNIDLQAEKQKTLLDKINKLTEEKNSLKAVPEQLLNYTQKLHEVQELQERLSILYREHIPRYTQAKNQREILAQQLLEAQEKHKLAMESANKGENQLACNRAGILAQGLNEGEPCPVCGSLHHPSPASLPATGITEEQVKRLRQTEQQAQKEKSKAGEQAAAAQAAIQTLEQQIGSYMMECLHSSIWQSLIEQKEADFLAIPEKASLRQLYELLQQQGGQLEQIRSMYNGKKEKLIGEKHSLDRLEKQLADASGKEAKAVEQQRSKAENEIAKVKASLAECEGQMAMLARFLENQGSDGQALEEYRRKLGEKQVELQRQAKDVRSRQEVLVQRARHNASWRQHIAAQQADFIKVLHDTAVITRLYNLVSGQTGNGKLTLEQYVQAAGFDNIIRAANRRLGPMSEGRYELYRQTRELGNKSHNYLDLEVLDNYTGHRRPVRNLSGGESFKASLALALGLSDTVSSQLGGLSIDALFVDEGFGTLDRKSLEKALEILLQLSDSSKLVAIISHREELIEAIPQQIQVIKDRQGSRLAISLNN